MDWIGHIICLFMIYLINENNDVLQIKPISDMDIYIEIEGANSKKELLEERVGEKIIII